MVPNIPLCVNCVCNIRGTPTECCTYPILAGWPFCYWAAIKQAMTNGTRKTYRGPISLMKTIL